jgi:hypothetical protein
MSCYTKVNSNSFLRLKKLTSTTLADLQSTGIPAPCDNIPKITEWTVESFNLQVASQGNPGVDRMSATRFVFVDDANDQIVAYSFNGSTFTLEGSALSIGSLQPGVAAMSSTLAAVVVSNQLKAYVFNGSSWALQGNAFTMAGGVDRPSLTALSSTRIAMIDRNNDWLRTFDFDGTDWVLVGNNLSVTYGTVSDIAAVNSDTVVFGNNTSRELQAYQFNGTDWSFIGSKAYPEVQSYYICALDENYIVTIGSTTMRTWFWTGGFFVETNNADTQSFTGGTVKSLAPIGAQSIVYTETGT